MGRRKVYTDDAQRARVFNAVQSLLASPTRTIQVRRGEDDAAHIVRILGGKGHKARAVKNKGVWVVMLEAAVPGSIAVDADNPVIHLLDAESEEAK